MKMASVDPDFAGTDAFYEMCGLDTETIARIHAGIERIKPLDNA